MTGGRARTAAAAAITALVLGLPCAAWYVTGSRSVREEAARLERAALEQARDEARLLAARIGERLESLRHSESRRAHADYSPVETPEGCDVPLQSPLAEGPTDPLVWTHFQIDETGELTLPSLVLDGPAARQDQLADEARALERALRQLVALELPAAPAPANGPAARKGDGVITIGPLSWATLELEREPVLVATREVTTPRAALLQGFVVRAQQLEELVAGTPLPARVMVGPPTGPAEAALPIEATWRLTLDPASAIEGARIAGTGVARRFHRSFVAGLVATLFGGGLVVGIVWHADRLASQRARFAAAAAHELRTPLAGLQLYGEMLAEGTGDPTRTRDYARAIASEAERLGRIVFNLLGFSRLERGELRVQPATGDLARAVREILERMRPSLESRGARVELGVRGELPPARFDPDALHQMLENLLDNAIKHGRAGAEGAIEVLLEPQADASVLSVRDHGPGLAPAVRRRLFRPFVRHAGGGQTQGGLGIGLALVAALARAQRARAGYRPAAEGGSVFWLSFPHAAA